MSIFASLRKERAPMGGISHRIVKTNGINVRIAEAGSGPLVLMLHGWPESWYSWRHQLPALADAGFHAVAPDVRGYGGSDKPHAIEAYSMKNMVADALGIVDELDAETAVVIGHDWGAPMAWTSAALHPDRYRAVVGMSVPYTGRSAGPPLQMMNQIFADSFFYIVYFQDVGKAEAELEKDVRRSMKLVLYTASGDAPPGMTGFAGKSKDSGLLDGITEPEKLPPWLTEEDLDYFTKEFEGSGFRGPINRYRNMDRDWEEIPELATLKINQPALFLAGEKDGVIAMQPNFPETMKQWVPNVQVKLYPGAGHWTQQERPKEVNADLIAFLKGLS
jgi:pimeloyl-ACP methyl ester carboxylesterase